MHPAQQAAIVDRVVALTWRERGDDGHFGGWISDPMPVLTDADGFHVEPA